MTRALVALAAGTVAAAGVLYLVRSFAFVAVLAAAAVFALAAPII